MSYTILIGGYNQSRFGGIQELTLRNDGTLAGITALNGIMNPSYLAWLPETRRLFSVGENQGGAELALMEYEGACTTVLSRAPFDGKNVCHVGVTPDGSLCGGACYTSGDVTIWSVGARGFIREVFHKNYNRNGAVAHPHCMLPSPDGRFFFLVDLGRDCIDTFDCTGALPAEKTRLTLREGDGPRQLLFHPTLPVAWLMTEYSNVVYTLGYDDGGFTVLQRLSTLPEEYRETTYGASLAYNPHAGVLYASNRGMESIACYHVAQDGLLTPFGIVSCGGSWPRHVAVTRDGNFLLVCNEHTSALTVLPIDTAGVPGDPVASVSHKRCSFAVEI